MKIELPLDGSSAVRVREASQVVFKSRYQLEILLVMAQEDVFYHGQIVSNVPGSGGSFVTAVLKRYQDGGVIRVVPTDEGQSRGYYEKRVPNDPMWPFVPTWVDFLLSDPVGEVAQLRP